MSALRTALAEPERPKDLQIRFIALGGSYVDVIGPGHSSDKHRWTCRGCQETSDRPEQDCLFRIRRGANDHANLCRAIPLT
ncbi:hypothetical protein ACFVRB_12565 [Streptomyces nojiriensis]|uniref:hypothetical protein n=1 Tax=Streptomyces nojiriensis TaxID=66374 RepID=UPI0036DAD260